MNPAPAGSPGAQDAVTEKAGYNPSGLGHCSDSACAAPAAEEGATLLSGPPRALQTP